MSAIQSESWVIYSEGIYISNYGNIVKDKLSKGFSPHIVVGNDNGRGYLYTNIYGTTKLIHRLVAECFIPNPNNLREVDHIDRDKQNNHYTNLRWVSSSTNNKNKNAYNRLNEKCIYLSESGTYCFKIVGRIQKTYKTLPLARAARDAWIIANNYYEY